MIRIYKVAADSYDYEVDGVVSMSSCCSVEEVLVELAAAIANGTDSDEYFYQDEFNTKADRSAIGFYSPQPVELVVEEEELGSIKTAHPELFI